MKSPAALLLLTLCSSTLVAQATKQQGAAKTPAPNAAMAPIDRERSIYVALEKNDIAAFNEAVGADFMYVSPDGPPMKWERAKSAEILKDCKTGKQTLSNVVSTPQGDDLMIVTYTVAGDQACGGKKSPSTNNALSVWRKMGGRWVAVAHSETPTAPAAK